MMQSVLTDWVQTWDWDDTIWAKNKP